MKKTNPKLILNLNLEQAELDNKISIAIDEYINNFVCSGEADAKVAEHVHKYIDKRVNNILLEKRWDNSSLIGGVSLDTYIQKIAGPKVEQAIDKIINKLISERISKIIGDNNG